MERLDTILCRTCETIKTMYDKGRQGLNGSLRNIVLIKQPIPATAVAHLLSLVFLSLTFVKRVRLSETLKQICMIYILNKIMKFNESH